jgi:hypothetical protein
VPQAAESARRLDRDAAGRTQLGSLVLRDLGDDVRTLEQLGALVRSRPALDVRILENLVNRSSLPVLAKKKLNGFLRLVERPTIASLPVVLPPAGALRG